MKEKRWARQMGILGLVAGAAGFAAELFTLAYLTRESRRPGRPAAKRAFAAAFPEPLPVAVPARLPRAFPALPVLNREPVRASL